MATCLAVGAAAVPARAWPSVTSALAASALLAFAASGAFSAIVATLGWADVARVPLGGMLASLLVTDATWAHPGIVGAFVASAAATAALSLAPGRVRAARASRALSPAVAGVVSTALWGVLLLTSPEDRPGTRNLGRMHLGDVLLLSLILVGCVGMRIPARLPPYALALGPLGAVALAVPPPPPCARTATALRLDARSVTAGGLAVLALLPTMHAVKDVRQEYSEELFRVGTPLELFAWCHVIAIALWLLLVHAPLLRTWVDAVPFLVFVACVNHNVAAATTLLLVSPSR